MPAKWERQAAKVRSGEEVPDTSTLHVIGAWRSLVARGLWVAEVPGSNPGAPIELLLASTGSRQGRRGMAGKPLSCYSALRWYMVNELEMPSEDVAITLGHQDGGNLVRRLYGHRDKGRTLDRIVGAYANVVSGAVRENRPKRSGSSNAASSRQSLCGDTYV